MLARKRAAALKRSVISVSAAARMRATYSSASRSARARADGDRRPSRPPPPCRAAGWWRHRRHALHRSRSRASGCSARIGGKRCRDHRRADAADLVAFGVDRGDEHGVGVGLWSVKAVRRTRRDHAGDCWERGAPRLDASVPSACRGTRLGGGGTPSLAQRSRASSSARNRNEVCTTLVGCSKAPVAGFSARGSA